MFVILGANGKVGRHSIEALRRLGAPVRAVIRNAGHAAALQALGCDIAMADIHDGEALRHAMREAQAVQIICPSARAATMPARRCRPRSRRSAQPWPTPVRDPRWRFPTMAPITPAIPALP
ncbi:SDR family oxidoreductase [Labrys neptuniae]